MPIMTRKPLLLALIAMLLLSACGTGRSLRLAVQSYERGEYFEAARHYKAVYTRTPAKERKLRGELAFRQAECYRRINQTLKAKAAYLNAVRYRYADSIAHFYLAEMLRKNGEYAAAIPYYDNYLAYAHRLPATAGRKDSLARAGLLSCRLAQEWKKQPTRYVVRRASSFATRYSDYSPMYAGADADILYFTSTRKEAKGTDNNPITGMKSADIFRAKRNERKQWQRPEALASEVNTPFEEGSCAFSPDGGVMYFTRCRTLPDAPAYAEIYLSRRTGAEWAAPQRCAILNDSLSSVAHPAVSPAGDYLYFVSDMPGGQGGLDIWRARILPDGFGYVDNLGAEVNTAGDEMFPTFAPDGTLYFSSTGHPGMGGLDIFRANPDTLSGKWRVENLRAPVNSAGDDFGMTFEPGAPQRGFFSSNRGDARGWDHLYTFELPEVRHLLSGVVYDKEGGTLNNAVVTLAGDDGSYQKINTRRDGTFSHAVEPGRHYVLLASCRGYLNKQEELLTESVEEDRSYKVEFALSSITRPVLIENIFYEFDRADLTPASAAALDELVLLLTDNPHVTIELAAHCDYFGDDAYNLRLSQRRAESVVRYLIRAGIHPDRLSAKGYGEEQPKTVTRFTMQSAPFLNEGDVLTEEYIKTLTPEQQEVCNALNRRTEFRVIRTNFR